MGKVSGTNLIPSEVLKSKGNWWAPLTISLFMYINYTFQIPKNRNYSITGSLFKTFPNIVGSVSKHSGKIYTCILFQKLLDLLQIINKTKMKYISN